jgi:hypothetical protein
MNKIKVLIAICYFFMAYNLIVKIKYGWFPILISAFLAFLLHFIDYRKNLRK